MLKTTNLPQQDSHAPDISHSFTAKAVHHLTTLVGTMHYQSSGDKTLYPLDGFVTGLNKHFKVST